MSDECFICFGYSHIKHQRMWKASSMDKAVTKTHLDHVSGQLGLSLDEALQNLKEVIAVEIKCSEYPWKQCVVAAFFIGGLYL